MSTGYDSTILNCTHNDYANEETEAYYAMCQGACSTVETLCSKCIDDAVEDAN